MTVESSVFDLVITRPSSSDDNCDRGVQPSISLESQMEEGYYILTNSTGKIEISCKPTVPQRLATYRFHVRHKGREGWARYTCRIKDGEKAVSIDTDPFDIDAVFVTSQLDTHTIDVTTETCTIHLDPENKDMKIVFPPNCVRSTMKVTIQVTKSDDSIKKEQIQQILGNEHGILGVSDLVNVSHEHPFLVPVHLTLPIPLLHPIPENGKPTFYVLHVEGDEVRELKSANVQRIDDDVFEIITDCFSSCKCVRSLSDVRPSSVISLVESIHCSDDDLRCNILVFLKREPDGKFRLRSEIVSQHKIREKETERANAMGMDPLSICQSPTITLKNMDRVRVSLGNKAIVFHSNPSTRCIIYDRKNLDNSLTYLVRKNTEFGTYGYASLEYTLDSGKRGLLHRTDFYVDLVTDIKNQTKPNIPCTPRDSPNEENPSSPSRDNAAEYSGWVENHHLAPGLVGEYTDFAVFLGIPTEEADRLASNHREREKMFRLLLYWLQKKNIGPKQRLDKLVKALKDIGQTVLAERVEDAFNNRAPFES